MFTSKSLLDSITVGRLEFDCTNIVAWLKANPHSVMRWDDMPLPIEQIGFAGQVTRLSGGCYGAVFKLAGYPGLILKVCLREDDGYPEYIRSVAVKRAPAWAPKIFAHGGDEAQGGFWCVMPAYEELRMNKYGGAQSVEALHLMSVACEEGLYRTRHKSNEFVRTYRRDIEDTLGSMWRFGAASDMHPGNVMFDPTTGHHVITDPLSRWEPYEKEGYRNAHS